MTLVQAFELGFATGAGLLSLIVSCTLLTSARRAGEKGGLL